jgi:hypothetical protein
VVEGRNSSPRALAWRRDQDQVGGTGHLAILGHLTVTTGRPGNQVWRLDVPVVADALQWVYPNKLIPTEVRAT